MRTKVNRLPRMRLRALLLFLAVFGYALSAFPAYFEAVNATHQGMDGTIRLYHGYHDNVVRAGGTPVFSTGVSGVDGNQAFPGVTANDTASKDSFIATINARLNGGNYQDRVGAAFIINTMFFGGDRPPGVTTPDQGVTYARSVYSQWVDMVNYYHTIGKVNWQSDQNYSGNITNSRFSGGVDDQFYKTGLSYNEPGFNSIVFYHPTASPAQIVYRIKKNCGNPIGSLVPIPFYWKHNARINTGSGLTNSTPAAGSTVSVGSVITVYADSQNSGTGSSSTHALEIWGHTNDSYVNVTAFSSGGVSQGAQGRVQWPSIAGLAASANSTDRSVTYTVNNNAVHGNQVCFRARVQPESGTSVPYSVINGSWDPSVTILCYTINNPPTGWQYNGRVLSPGQTVEPNDVITIIGDATNSGAGTGVAAFTVEIYPSQGDTSLGVPSNLSSGGTWVGTTARWSETAAITTGNNSPDRSASYTIKSDASDGSVICFNVRVSPIAGQSTPVLTTTDFNWDSGTQICFTVEAPERPYLEVHGADVWSGAVFADQQDWLSSSACSQGTALAVRNSTGLIRTVTPVGGRGSVGDFGVFATDDIFGFGSNGLVGGNTLTFANTINPPGNFADDGRCISNYFELFTDGTLNPTNNGGNLALLDGQYRWSGASGATLTIGGGGAVTIPLGNQLIFLVDGNVTITNNISYQNNYVAPDTSAIPLFTLIVRGNINILGGVTRLDGAYIAVPSDEFNPTNGIINTCSNAPAQITIGSVCDNLLTINGIFVAQKVNFERVAGGLQRGGPAENFIFSPELYLAEPDFSTQYFSLFNTEQFKDLPPVY